MKSICFVLPQYPLRISGGYKIAFEYANRLVNDDFDVSILFINDGAPHFLNVPKFIKRIIMNTVTKKKIAWFNLDSRIKIYSSTERNIKSQLVNIDIVIATAAIVVNKTLNLFSSKSKKIYLIQDFETWDLDKSELYCTYNSGFKNIVISKWLKKLVDEHSNTSSFYIRNPINTNIYKTYIPSTKRDKYTIGMLYHSAPHKGCKYALEAIFKAKKKFPKLKLIMFGTTEPDFKLPDWIEFHYKASQEETVNIYNSVNIFVCGTIEEGFGLTGLEAMACGAALVSTDYQGVREYAENKKNALLSPVKDSKELFNNIVELIEHSEIKENIVKNGQKTVLKFSWDEAYNKLKQVILN